MNAKSLAALPLGHALRYGAALVALALAASLAGCANPVSRASSGPPRCAELVAHAFASQVSVIGAYACLAPNIQTEAALLTPSVTDDVSFAAYAATDPIFTAYSYKGSKFDATTKKLWHYFEFTPGPNCWRGHVNPAGLVDVGAWKPGACLPLP